jgi:tetratricopeptide (TPR) repeat protein
MDEQNNPKVKFIAQMSGRIFERVIRGQIDYDADMKALQKYRDMAIQENAPIQEAGIINNMAILNSFAGHLKLAEQQLIDLFEIYKRLNNLSGMALAYNNRAFFLVTLGRYDEAQAIYTEAIAFCEAHLEETFRSYARILSGLMAASYMRQQYDNIPAYFAKIEAIQDKLLENNRQNYANIMTEVYRNLGEYHLHQKDYAQAQSMIRLGMSFATGLDLLFELADLYYTQAHIALAMGNPDEAEASWTKALDILDKVTAKANVGRNLTEEARYLARHGYPDYSRRFAKYAYDIFEGLNMSEDANLAVALL